MLIVDLNTLEAVYTLYFTDHVILYGTYALDSQDIMRIHATFCQLVTGFQNLTVQNLHTGTVWNQVGLGIACLRICNDDLTFLLGIVDCNNTFDFCNNSKTFRFSCLKKLLDTRKTLCNIAAGNTTGMESTHGKLCTRLTDRLCCDNTNRFTNLYRLTGCHVGTVTFCTDTDFASAGKNGTDLHFIDCSACFADALFHNAGCTLRRNHMVGFYKNFAVFVIDGVAGISSCNTFLQALDFFLAV